MRTTTTKFFLWLMLSTEVVIAQSNQTFFMGHSLINFHIPNMVNKLSQAGNKNFSYYAHIGNGANLMWHYNNPYSAQGDIWDTTLALGGFQHFIVTEAVPLKGHLQWSKTYQYADTFYQYAKQYNPGIKYYLYETWHCINSGTPTGCDWDNDDHIHWRTRLTQDLPLWEGIADSVNALHPEDMLIIPGGQAMAALYDSIAAGIVPGFSSINQLFTDDIHLTNVGNYFIACVMYSVIHQTSPVGLPNRLTDPWGTLYTAYPTAAQAAKLQQIAWAVVCNYARDGVNCQITGSDDVFVQQNIKIYPNPFHNHVTIETARAAIVQVHDVTGKLVYKTPFSDSPQVTNLYLPTHGLYVVSVTYPNEQTKYFKILNGCDK